jgi:hypothetical protein
VKSAASTTRTLRRERSGLASAVGPPPQRDGEADGGEHTRRDWREPEQIDDDRDHCEGDERANERHGRGKPSGEVRVEPQHGGLGDSAHEQGGGHGASERVAVLDGYEPEEGKTGQGESHDKTADGVAETALRGGTGEDRGGGEEEAKCEENHASIIFGILGKLTRNQTH